MKKILSLSFAATTFAILTLSTGCPGNIEDGGPGGDGDGDTDDYDCGEKNGEAIPSCVRPIDCTGGSVCTKPEEANGPDDFGCCLKIFCVADEDCDTETEKCDVRRGICVPKNLCDPNNDASCPGGEFCIYNEGVPQCVAAGDLPQPDNCEVTPANIYAGAGSAVEVQATGALDSGALVPNATFTFSSDVGTASGNVITAECAGAEPCVGTVTATSVNNKTCTAAITVYPAVDAADTRVVLFNQTTGAAWADVDVAILKDGVLTEGTTDDSGAFTATARIARPNRVKRKNANTAASSARVTSRTPTSWADR